MLGPDENGFDVQLQVRGLWCVWRRSCVSARRSLWRPRGGRRHLHPSHISYLSNSKAADTPTVLPLLTASCSLPLSLALALSTFCQLHHFFLLGDLNFRLSLPCAASPSHHPQAVGGPYDNMLGAEQKQRQWSPADVLRQVHDAAHEKADGWRARAYR